MNQTKFRFWNGYNFQFVNYIKWNEDGSIAEYGNDANHITSDKFDDNLLEQWTGLSDIEGKDIYVGNILKRHGGLYEVRLGQGDFVSVPISGQGRLVSALHWNSFDSLIVGDVHQNPELLEAD